MAPTFEIGVATFRRPAELVRLLKSIESSLEFPDDWVFHGVMVVDNDPERSGCTALQNFSTPLVVRCVAEATPGIAAARNRIVDEVATRSDVVIMIDDDMIALEGWPRGLIETADRFGCLVVAGPVEPRPAVAVPDWMFQPNFLGRNNYEDGAAISGFATNNVFIDLRLRRIVSPLFDLRFGLTGGSDSMLSAVCRIHGVDMRWSATASTADLYPAERCTFEWVRRRQRRAGSTRAMVELCVAQSARQRMGVRLRYGGRAIATIFASVIFVSFMVITGRREAPSMLVWRRRASWAVGLLIGLFGRVPEAYGANGFDSPKVPNQRAVTEP